MNQIGLFLAMVVALLALPGVAADDLPIPPLPVLEDEQSQSAPDPDSLANIVREQLKQMFPDDAPFPPNCVKYDEQYRKSDLSDPAGADVDENADRYTVVIWAHETLIFVEIDMGCLAKAQPPKGPL